MGRSGGHRSLRVRPRPATLAVLAALIAVAVVVTLVVRGVVLDQEQRLRDRRAQEAATYVQSLADGVETSLVAASGLALLSPAPELFGTVVGQLSGTLGDIVLVSVDDATVVASANDALPAGAVLTGPRAELLREAGDTLRVTPVMGTGEERRIGFAVAVPGGGGAGGASHAVYVEFAFDLAVSALEDGEAFADLDAALYAGTAADPADLVLLSGSTAVPSGDDVGRVEVPIGQATWLLEIEPRSPLVGTAARATPWIVLVSGLAVAAMTAVLVEALLRRHSYAMALVAERTRELEAAQEELRAADAMKDEFLANVSHELRTPLTAVAGFSDLLLRTDDYDDATRRQLLERIRRNAADMGRMVERLLDYARLAAGRIPFEPRPLPLLEQVHAAVAAHDHALDGRAVHVDVDPGLRVLADASSLGHILGNLLANAAKFSPPDTPIDVVATVEDGEVVVRVVDLGPGIPPEEAEALFDRFVQGNGAAGVKGLGLGLAIAKRHVELHGGRIWFDAGQAKGASAAFAVPRADAGRD